MHAAANWLGFIASHRHRQKKRGRRSRKGSARKPLQRGKKRNSVGRTETCLAGEIFFVLERSAMASNLIAMASNRTTLNGGVGRRRPRDDVRRLRRFGQRQRRSSRWSRPSAFYFETGLLMRLICFPSDPYYPKSKRCKCFASRSNVLSLAGDR